jgi:hypothetical protein
MALLGPDCVASGAVTLGSGRSRSDSVEDQVLDRVSEWSDPRLRWLHSQLTPEQWAIVEQKADDQQLTWAQAAIVTGAPAKTGETVRRRIDYLKKKYEPRRQALLVGAVGAGR